MKSKTYANPSEMIYAVVYGEYHYAAQLLFNEYEVDALEDDGGGRTLLHWAVQEGHTNIVQLLLERGANPEALDIHGITPFSVAASDGNLRFLKIMRHCGAHADGIPNQNVPLINVAAHNYSKCVRYLLHHGADVNAQDKDGSTALLSAVHNGHHGMASLLLRYGARTDVFETDGSLLWGLADRNQTPKTTRDIPADGGLTLWEMAEENGDAKMLRILDSGLGRANTGRPSFD